MSTPEEPARAATTLELPRALVEALLAHARRHFPREACGLLGGRQGRAERFFPTTNQEASPTAYSIPPGEILQVLEKLERERLELVGIFHSHPRGRAYPSAVDIRQAYYPEAVYLIASLAGTEPELRGYRIRGGRVEPVALRVSGEPLRARPSGGRGGLKQLSDGNS
ncbi:MAG: M67 family metallopeptidase [Bacillota bacterium]|nr:M67 family metallopeptidase [Bacillota bacterium]